MSRGPWRAPEAPDAGWHVGDAYTGIALLLLVLSPLLVLAHLLFAGMLASYIIEWHIRHERPTLMPQILFYGGLLSVVAIPLSFGVAGWRLRRDDPSAPVWRVLPWLSWLAWPGLTLGISFLFDLIRWSAEP